MTARAATAVLACALLAGGCGASDEGLKVRVSSLKVDGDHATAKAVVRTQSQEDDQLYGLRKENGDWRIASGRGG